MFLLLIGAFLWTPLTQDGLFGPFDILHSWAMVKAPGAPPVRNPIQSDVAIQILPFLAFNRAEFSAGRIPLWNPYSGWGAPHLANGQSGVFSPFALPVYLFDWRWGLLLSVALRLFVAGFFTYLLLRRFNVGFWPAVSAGTLYMFSGPLMVWLLWQNSAVAAMLPLAIHAAERVLRTPRAVPMVWLAIALAAGMYSGHPEQFFFVAATLVTYATLRIAIFPEIRAAWLRTGSWLAAGCALGAMLSAPQILPFAEYLQHSSEAGKTGARHAKLPGLHWTSLILQIQPDLFGSPGEPYEVTNYTEINSGYAGPGAWMLAAIALWAWWRNRSRAVLLFLSLFACWFFYIYDVFDWYARFLHRLPLFGMPVPKRAAMTGLLLLAGSAGLALDWLSKQPRELQRLRAAAVAGFWIFALAALYYHRHHLLVPSSAAHLVLPGRLAAVCAGMLLLSAWVVRPAAKWAFIMPLALFFQSGYQFRENTPAASVRSPEGHGAVFDEVRQRIGPDMAMWDSGTGMFSAMNMWYGLRMGSNYDAMGVRDFDTVGLRVWNSGPARYLTSFGMRYLVSNSPEPFLHRIDGLAAERLDRARLAGARLSREFRALSPGLNAVRVAFEGDVGQQQDCTVTIEVREAASGKLAARGEHRCHELTDRIHSWMRFEEISESQGRAYRVTVDGSRVPRGSALSVMMSPAGPAIEAASGIVGHLEPVWSGGGYHLFRVRDALPRFSTSGSAEVIADREKALTRLTAPDFQPLRHLVLESGTGAAHPSPAIAEPAVVEDSVQRIRLRVSRSEPGWLLALQPYFPGWSASVNGTQQPLLRANGCFTAVAVPAGESEVVLTYSPASFRTGVLLAIVGMVLCAGFLYRDRRAA